MALLTRQKRIYMPCWESPKKERLIPALGILGRPEEPENAQVEPIFDNLKDAFNVMHHKML
jgi:hypothetical protein